MSLKFKQFLSVLAILCVFLMSGQLVSAADGGAPGSAQWLSPSQAPDPSTLSGAVVVDEVHATAPSETGFNKPVEELQEVGGATHLEASPHYLPPPICYHGTRGAVETESITPA